MFLCLLAAAAAGCRTNSRIDNGCNVLRIESNFEQSVNIGDIFSSVYYVLPEFNDEHPVGEVTKAVIRDGIIFMSDGRTLFQYDMNGKYVRSMTRMGRGPQEYLGIADFALYDGYVYIIDRNMKILKYTVDNEFVSSAKLDFFPATVYVPDANNILLTSAYQSDVDKFSVYDSESLQRKTSFQPVEKAEITYRHIMGQSNFYEYAGRLLYHEPMNDSVYEIDAAGQTYTEKYRFDLFGKNPPDSFWQHEYESVVDVNITAVDRGYCFGLPVWAATESKMLFTYRDGADYRMCIYDRTSGMSRQFDALALHEAVPPVPVADVAFCFTDKDSQCIVFPEESLCGSDGRIHVDGMLPDKTGSGNPVIAVVHLK